MNEILQQRIEEAANEFDKESSRVIFENGANFILNNQWISVDEALPEEDENNKGFSVQVFVTGGIHRTTNAIYSFNDKKFYSAGFLLSSTHWMPIPSLEGGEK